MSEIARKSAETFVIRTIVQAISVGAGILIARSLGPTGKGLYVYVLTWAGIIVTLVAGQASAVAYEYGRRKRAARSVLLVSLRIFAGTIGPLLLVVAGVALSSPGQRPLFALLATLPFLALVQMFTGFFLAKSDVRAINVQQIILGPGFALLLVPTLLLGHLGVPGLFAAWAIAYVVAALYSLWRFRPYLVSPERRDAIYSGWEQFRFGMKVALNGVMAYLNFRIDVFIILALLGSAKLGVYSIGIGAGELVWQLSRPLAQAAFGRIGSSEERDAADLTAKCMRHSILMVTLASLVLWVLGPMLVTLVYGKAFAGAGSVIRMLLPGIIAYSAMPNLATFFSQQLGRPSIPLVFSTLSTAICAILTYATVPHWGIVGGAFATSLSYIIAFTAACVYFVRHTGIRARRVFIPDWNDFALYANVLRRGALRRT